MKITREVTFMLGNIVWDKSNGNYQISTTSIPTIVIDLMTVIYSVQSLRNKLSLVHNHWSINDQS